MTTLTHDMIDQLRALQAIIGQGNAERGFHEEGDRLRAIAERDQDADQALRNYYTARLALITTEVAEAIEELRKGRAVDETYYENPPLTQDALQAAVDRTPPKPLKPEGVPSEVADVVIRAFDFADEAGIDLAAMIEEKISFNQTRGHKHGKEF